MTVLTGRIDGRRESGGPRRQWYDDIKEWTGNHPYTNIKLAHNRVTWEKGGKSTLKSRDDNDNNNKNI